jgi:hypothetical protein
MPRRFKSIAAAILCGAAIASSAGAADLELSQGRLWGDDGDAKQVVAVTNHSLVTLEYVEIQCGFFHASQLIAATFGIIKNVQPGQTAYKEVIATDAPAADHADCRIAERH